MQLRIKNVDSPIIPFDNYYTSLQGKVENIIPLEHGYRILLTDIKIKKLPSKQTPYKIRLTVRTNINDVMIGDFVKVNAMLSKPMQPYLPDSYNFAQDAYFKQIGAVGYSLSDLQIKLKNDKSLKSKLNNLRHDIQIRVNNSIGNFTGSIATALMINEYSNIDKVVLKDLRDTGLAHILSVSGMHLSLVAAIFFLSTRFLINCFENIALHVHCKKIAASFSLLGSAAYLIISGMEVAAVRSFIMSSMIIIAIIIDRTSNPMRAIAFADGIILIIFPENILHPSFQMSFSAVLALIACFEIFSKINFNFANFNFIEKFLFYLLSICLASLVAGLATAPFSLYHFNHSSNYSILANLIAVPITTFWLMPLVVMTFLLYPLHLENLSLSIMKFGIELLIKIAHYIAKLPNSVTAFAKLTDFNLLIIIFGMLWFCIWNSRIRFIGIFIIIAGIFLQSFVKQPDIFIDWRNQTIAIVTSANQLVFIKKELPKFKKQLLMNHLGIRSSYIYQDSNSQELSCNQQSCSFIKKNCQVKIYLTPPKFEIFQKIIENGKETSFIYLKDYCS